MLNKIVKIVTGMLLGVIVIAGVRINANARPMYVWDGSELHMVDSEDEDAPTGLMAYDLVPDWAMVDDEVYSMLMSMMGMPQFVDFNSLLDDMNSQMMMNMNFDMGSLWSTDYSELNYLMLPQYSVFFNPDEDTYNMMMMYHEYLFLKKTGLL